LHNTSLESTADAGRWSGFGSVDYFTGGGTRSNVNRASSVVRRVLAWARSRRRSSIRPLWTRKTSVQVLTAAAEGRLKLHGLGRTRRSEPAGSLGHLSSGIGPEGGKTVAQSVWCMLWLFRWSS